MNHQAYYEICPVDRAREMLNRGSPEAAIHSAQEMAYVSQGREDFAQWRYWLDVTKIIRFFATIGPATAQDAYERYQKNAPTACQIEDLFK